MNNFIKILLASFGVLIVILDAHSVCPVCTIAVGAGLEGARLIGIDDIITGIWAGGLTLSLFFWTVGWLKKRGINSVIWQIIVPFISYYALLGMVYFMPGVVYGTNTLWGIDKFLIGTIVGTITFYLGSHWYIKIKRNNGGHANFPFQKVVIPIFFLLIATAIFAAILWLK